MADDERTALLDGIEGDLAGVERALARLDSGTYFSCEVCAATLDDERLAADPAQARCPACAALPAPSAAVEPDAGDEGGTADTAASDAPADPA